MPVLSAVKVKVMVSPAVRPVRFADLTRVIAGAWVIGVVSESLSGSGSVAPYGAVAVAVAVF